MRCGAAIILASVGIACHGSASSDASAVVAAPSSVDTSDAAPGSAKPPIRMPPTSSQATTPAPAADWSWIGIKTGIAVRAYTASDLPPFRVTPGRVDLDIYEAGVDGGKPRTILTVDDVNQLELPPGDYRVCPKYRYMFCQVVTVGATVVKMTATQGAMSSTGWRCDPATACRRAPTDDH